MQSGSHRRAVVAVVVAVLFPALAVACSKKEEAPSAPPSTAPPSATVALTDPVPSAAPVAELETSPDMKSFLAMLDGSAGSLGKALEKYGSKATSKDSLGALSLKDAKVTRAEKLGVMQCYTFEAMAGVVKHMTRTCWDSSGHVAQITDKT